MRAPGFSWPSEPENKASQLGNSTSSCGGEGVSSCLVTIRQGQGRLGGLRNTLTHPRVGWPQASCPPRPPHQEGRHPPPALDPQAGPSPPALVLRDVGAQRIKLGVSTKHIVPFGGAATEHSPVKGTGAGIGPTAEHNGLGGPGHLPQLARHQHPWQTRAGVPRGEPQAGPRTHPEVDDWQSGAVCAAHDAIQVLQPRGQERAEGAGQPRSACLLEALEVGAADASQAARLRAVERHQVQLRGSLGSARPARVGGGSPGGSPPCLRILPTPAPASPQHPTRPAPLP